LCQYTIPTSFQFIFTSWFPMTQSPETDVNLAISPKKIIRSILFSVPVIHGKNWYVTSLFLLFPCAQRTQWLTVMIHRIWSHIFIVYIQTEFWKSFLSQFKFYSQLLVPNFVFQLLGGHKIWTNCTNTILYAIKTNLP